jgi:hypothetical protein
MNVEIGTERPCNSFSLGIFVSNSRYCVFAVYGISSLILSIGKAKKINSKNTAIKES